MTCDRFGNQLCDLKHTCHILTCKACAFLGFDFLCGLAIVVTVGQRSKSKNTTESKARTDGTTANAI